MPAALVSLVVILAASAAALACDEEPAPSPQPEKKKSFPDCDGTLHRISQGKEERLLCHTDLQYDGIFQPETDALSIREGDRFVPFQQSFPGKFGLPNFPGLNLFQWKKARAYVFDGRTWGLEEEKLLSAITRYNRQRQSSLEEAARLAGGIGPWKDEANPDAKLTAMERGYALLLASLVVGLRDKRYENFHKSYPDFFPLVSEAIQRGELKVKDARTPLAGPLGDYYEEDHLIRFNKAPDYASEEIPANLIHDLSHFYQDLKGKIPSRSEFAVKSSLMEADYLLAQLGGDYSKASSQEFRNLVEAQLKRRKAFFSVEAIGGTHPLESALWTLYYRSRGETAKAMASTRELELLIEKITALFFFSQHAQEGVGSKGLQIFRSGLPGKASDAEILAKLEREMAILKLGKAGEIRRLKSLLRSREASKEKTEESYQKVARYWLLLAAFTHYRQELKKERLPNSEFYDASCKAVIQEMFTELVPLKFAQKTFNETAP